MSDDSGDESLIFFFGILLVEDTVGLVAESDTAEAVLARETLSRIQTIIHIIRVQHADREMTPMHMHTFVEVLRTIADIDTVVHVLTVVS